MSACTQIQPAQVGQRHLHEHPDAYRLNEPRVVEFASRQLLARMRCPWCGWIHFPPGAERAAPPEDEIARKETPCTTPT